MSQGSDASAPVIWLLTDNKPGHKNQLRGLGNRLRVLAGADIHWVSAPDYPVALWRALLGVAPASLPTLPQPALIIAAGTGTHRLLLALRRHKQAKSVVLMKPAFPIHWIDAALIPAHDNVKPGRNVLMTEGVINAATPLARLTSKPEALALIGGPSAHFDWHDDAILAQLSDLMARYPDWRWTISDSRRTPDTVFEKLSELQSPKVSVVSHHQTHDSWLNHQLAASRAVWVTPDSQSMVCEAITSGVPTGLLELAPLKGSRVAKGVEHLLQRGLVAHWADHASVMTHQAEHQTKLWEADRAARWLIKQFLAKHQNRGRE
ncbi:mitochondrial fission ELM1 family protein [Marinobacter sp. VGCF2001]|uniref:mitochondrial fission ELM1 family protein n=1 Tax=Marinobacter sp. VGCF2001 TaxID=3417189 RepID=UPI003CF8413D